MQRNGDLRVLIVGGGIGGLTTGYALRRAGIDATVFERAPDLKHIQVGSGIALWPNSARAMRELGLLDRALPVCSPPLEVSEFRTWQGKLLATWSLGDLSRRVGAPVLGVSRGDLHPVLAAALDDGVLQLGATCVDFEQDATGVTVRLADGREERGDILVAADGRQSQIRKKLGKAPPDFPPYAGFTVWHGIVEFEHPEAPPELFCLLFGCGLRFIYYHIDPRRLYWTVQGYVPPGGKDPQGLTKQIVLDQLKGWMPPAEAMVEATPDRDMSRLDIHGSVPLEQWGEGRVTLLGDSAHPMSPTMGQGAGMAIEDALVLTRCLTSHRDPVEGLRAYEERRMARTSTLMQAQQRFGSNEAKEKPWRCWIRDRALSFAFSRVVQRTWEEIIIAEP